MKRLNFKYLLVAILPFAIASCTEDELVTLNPNASVTPTASSTDVVLVQEEEGTDALTISWPEPEYGFSAAPSNTIMFDIEGGDFSAAAAVNIGADVSKTFKVEELNKILLALGFEPEQAGVLQYKVESKLGTYEKIVSEVKTLNATPYSAFLDLSTTWGVVGSGYNDWGAHPDAPFFTTSTAGVLVAFVKLVNGEIKFRENNEWANNYGDNGGDGTLEKDGSNIPVTAGRYKITFNTSTYAYSIEKYSWGIVGDAYNDWGATPDYPFTYDDATDQWRAVVKLKDGKFKIRKNEDWGKNYGDTGNDGNLEEGGDDIPISAGKYQLTFNEKELTLEIVPLDRIWGLVGDAYNNWGATPDAQFEPDWRNEGQYILKNVKLVDGKWKVRDDNSWGTNYGDDGADNTLELNGADITASAGYYTITLDFTDPDSPTWSWVKH